MKIFKAEESRYTSLREEGFTLIEILIALAIMSIVTAAIYQLYISQYKTWVSQDLITEMQQNARVSIDTISRDLLMAGYGVTTAIETDAGGSDNSQIAIRYKDPNDGNKIKRIMYWRNASENILYRKEDTAVPNSESSLNSGSPGRVWSGGQPLADNVTSLGFIYFKSDGSTVSPPNDVYRVKVSLEVQTSKKDPITGDWKKLTLSTDVRPRNIGIGGVAADTTPPEVPGRPTVTDPQICGTLNISWSPVANAAGDLAGYVIYVGPASGTYTRKISLGNVTSYTLTGLDNGTKYYIAITSRDKSGNESAYSLEAYGDGTSGPPAGDGTANDTKPDANVPGQPVWLDEAATASTSGSPYVDLKWKANSVTYPTDTDIKGYQIWRKGHTEGDDKWTNLTPTLDTLVPGTTYHDSTVPEAGKCSIYDYRIVAVNACNTSLVSAPSSTVFGDKDRTSLVDQPTNGITNTMPSDGTKPGKPVITASKAGYRRDYINWNNPSDGDLDSIVIRYNKACGTLLGMTSPATATDGTGIEEYPPDGRIPGEPPSATGRTFTHNGTLSGTPNLGEGCTDNIATYAYSLFAVDKCGNYSDKDVAATTTVAQCGEATPADTQRKICQEGAPTWTNAGCSGTTESGFAISNSCGNNYTFTWNRIDDSPNKIWDLAGYYIYRRLATASWTPSGSDTDKYTGLILNSASLSWSDLSSALGTDNDSDIAGKAYQYYVIPIDCNRQTNLNANPWATFAESPTPLPTASEVITVMPGRVTFGNNTSVTTGYLNFASPFTAPNYYHNTVDVRLKNTSAGSVKLKSMVVSWTKPSFLKTIYKKNADGTWTDIWTTASPVASGATVSFSTALGVEGVGNATNPWNLRFLFTAADGSVTSSQDMREDTVTVTDIKYDKIFTKGTTQITPPCTFTTPETIKVPIGPAFVATSQDRTSTEIVSSSLSPGYWVIGAGLNVNVFARVADSSGVGIESVKLYYTTTDTPADPSSATPPALPYGNELPMYNIGGTEYAIYNPNTEQGAKIPSSPGKTIWYYIIAKDKKGNFDMAPERQDGVYTYSQKSVDPCAVTPNPPTGLTGTAVGGATNTVSLSWAAPTGYTNGDTLYSSDSFKYRVYRRNGFTGNYYRITDGECSGDLTSKSCVDTGKTSDGVPLNVEANNNSYRVFAINTCKLVTPTSCDPTTQYCSDRSNTWSECIGGGGSLLLNALSPVGPITAGQSFTITVNNCLLGGNANANDFQDNVTVTSSLGGDAITTYSIPEDAGNTGSFTWAITTKTGTATHPAQIKVAPTATQNDTVTVSLAGATGSPRTIAVAYDVCSDIPAKPTGLIKTSASVDCNSDKSIWLQWNANSEADVIGYDVYQIAPGSSILVCSTNSRTATSCKVDTKNCLGAACKLNGSNFQWVVMAKDSCATPNVSPPSDTYSDPCP